MRVTERLGHEIYLAEPDPERPSCMTTWNKGEFLSATGQERSTEYRVPSTE
jgi:tRNA (mo5U34)-methyltransferase